MQPPPSSHSARPGLGAILFLLGSLAGVLATWISEELWPGTEDPMVAPLREVRDFVRESFVREVGDEELLDLALHGMVDGLDPYSRYYDHDEALALERETGGRYTGVGIVFRRPLAEGVVLFTLPDSPGRRAGLEVGDRLVAIEGQTPEQLGESRMRELLSDTQGEALVLRVRSRNGSDRELTVRPDSVVDPTVRHATILDPACSIGYLAILSFSRQTPQEFDQSFQWLQRLGMRGLVLDLRRNFGGVLESAVAIARRFVPASEVGSRSVPASDLIVSTEGRGEPIYYRADSREALYAGFPLVVLVDGDSASASEVLAGALQDHRVAVVTGSPTYGKGMVQTIRRFQERGTMAKVTSAYYYSPTHRNFERTVDPDREYGILPDLSIPLSEEQCALVHRWLGHYSPPLDSIAAVEAWQAEEQTSFLEPRPEDPQLDAALELLRGRLPGPHPLASEQ
jgi:carboxyl-terminal processing protease